MANTNTVFMYKWENYQAVKGWESRFGYCMEGELLSFDFVGEYGELVEYELPPGYKYAESHMGMMLIYDNRGKHCEILYSQAGPVLESSNARVVLKNVNKGVENS